MGFVVGVSVGGGVGVDAGVAVGAASVGVAGVAEPAAMLAAQTRELLMPKRRGRRVTMALARREA